MVINENVSEAIVIRDEEDANTIDLANIPEIDTQLQHPDRSMRNEKRGKTNDRDKAYDGDDSSLFEPRTTTKRDNADVELGDNDEEGTEEAQDDKKKLSLNTSYDGFSIYGRILCLVVKRCGTRTQTGKGMVPASSQAMLENWVSTQAALEQVGDAEDNG